MWYISKQLTFAVHHFLFAFGHFVLHLDLGGVVCHREDSRTWY
jgi:hypothetical protein